MTRDIDVIVISLTPETDVIVISVTRDESEDINNRETFLELELVSVKWHTVIIIIIIIIVIIIIIIIITW